MQRWLPHKLLHRLMCLKYIREVATQACHRCTLKDQVHLIRCSGLSPANCWAISVDNPSLVPHLPSVVYRRGPRGQL